MEGVFYMQSLPKEGLCITQRIDLRGTYTYPKKGIHYSAYTLKAISETITK